MASRRLQAYVDDPALTLCGTTEAISTSIDLCCLWWMILGVPLAWKKGSVFDPYHQDYAWIGVNFSITEEHLARMRLPDAFVKDLDESLEPLCAGKGTVPRSDLATILGISRRRWHLIERKYDLLCVNK